MRKNITASGENHRLFLAILCFVFMALMGVFFMMTAKAQCAPDDIICQSMP